ncbi:type VII secretion-associated serine protease mycosin [Pilimelia columellifera]|uniref:Peptidase S8/S53 domain-containing protein n=1 Tax=Pilimelia columellifera subsp. columellifera TaxID=706583 RepID=A0ABP6ABB4_9ACTN
MRYLATRRGLSTLRTMAAIAASAAAAVAAPSVATAAVTRTAAATRCAPQGPVAARAPESSWAQRAMDPQRITPFADGRSVTVAVLDSGVDARHPQLRGQVLPGRDFLAGGRGSVDCHGHGTGVAGVIAARPAPRSALLGLAPGVRILPIRLTERHEANGQTTGAGADAGQLAAAIRWSVDQGADVLNLSLTLYRDDPAVRKAVAYAVDRDVIMVAAVGNHHDQSARQQGVPDPVPYPAAYPGVLGVGAVDPTGGRVADSQVGGYVDVVAPGGQIVVAWPGGYSAQSGTSFATPFVSATAALVRQRWPGLTAQQVARRVVATADPAAGGRAAYGHGMVSPYRAVSDPPGASAAATLPPLGAGGDHGRSTLLAERDRSARTALALAAAGGGVLLAAGVAATVTARGRRRRWRPAAS